jgi:hypothetical protein
MALDAPPDPVVRVKNSRSLIALVKLSREEAVTNPWTVKVFDRAVAKRYFGYSPYRGTENITSSDRYTEVFVYPRRSNDVINCNSVEICLGK